MNDSWFDFSTDMQFIYIYPVKNNTIKPTKEVFQKNWEFQPFYS